MSELIYKERIGKDELVIRPFEEKDAPGLAKLLNESEEGWPGGFTGGIPFTADRVLEEAKREKPLVYYVLTLNDQILGVCTLSEHWLEKSVAYVSFLNLHPKHHGKGFGRRLLMQGIKYAIDKGFKRIDIHTWEGNMKAVPLYKKTGFFWMPGTRVYLQNHVPAILNFPLAKEFFHKHPDWYGNFQRALEVKEDDMKEKGINAFIYRWEKNGKKLKAIIDREAFSIAGIEDDEISILCWPTEHETPAGFAQKITWQIENKTERDIQCSLLVSSEDGIEISKEPPQSFTVERLQKRTFVGEVKIDPKIKRKDEDEPAHRIETSLILDGRLIPITIGLRVKPPVELSFDPRGFSGYPGCEGKLRVTLKSNVKRPVEGILSLVPHPMIQASPLRQAFEISEEGYAGTTFNIRIHEDAGNSVIPLRFSITIRADRYEVKTKERVFNVKSFTPGGVLAAPEEDQRTLILENETTSVVLGLHRGGRIRALRTKVTERQHIGHFHDAVGPPFWPTEIDRKDFNYEIYREDGAIRAMLYTDLDTYEGLRIVKDFTIFPSAEMLRLQYSFVNSSTTTKHDFQLNMGMYLHIGDARMIVPLKQGILSATVDGDFPHWRADIPEDPDSFSESWLCFEFPGTREIFGILWHREGVVKTRMGGMELFIKAEAVQPQSSVALKPIYLVGGFGSWPKVRELWRRLIQGQIRKEIHYRKTKAKAVVETDLKPYIMDVPESIDAKLVVHNRRGKKLSGDLAIDPPKGWSIKPRRIELKDVSLEEPLERSVTITPKKKMAPGAYKGNIRISTSLTTIESPFHLLVLGQKGAVQVGKTKEEREIFYADNGRLVLKLCPGLAGTVYSLTDSETGVDHLLSAFPDPKPYGYQKPWFGGMRFAAWKSWKYNKMHEEKFHCEKAERDGWTGLKVFTSPGDKVKDLRGISIECHYLTKPRSNIIARILRIDNHTSARMTFEAQQSTFLQVGGSIEDNVAYFKKDEKVLMRRRIRRMARVPADSRWLQVTNEKTEDSLIMVSTVTERGRVVMHDWGELGVNLAMHTSVLVDPQKPLEILSYLIVTKGHKAYEDYKCLEDYLLPSLAQIVACGA